MIPQSLLEAVVTALQAAGDSSPLRGSQALGGGCINNAHRVTTAERSYLLKWNQQSLPGMFPAEVRGLALMQATNSVRVPAVLAAADAVADRPAYILMEWLDSAPGARGADQSALGAQLAAMHRADAPAYGLDHDNYIGSTPQFNGWESDWTRFFRERRLRPQVELAQRNGLLTTARRRGLERLMERLDEWLGGVERRPALIHGDLWSGNLLLCGDGTFALIDPAVYYGDREAELAYTELFGGFSARFYAAYRDTWPLAPGYADRRDLYNLYHLLNHLNLFGEGYGGQVDAIVKRYVG